MINEILQIADAEGISRVELAKRAGISRRGLYKIINNPSSIKVDLIARMCAAIKKDLRITFDRRGVVRTDIVAIYKMSGE